MAFIDIALAVGAAVGLEGTAAVVGGGALIGAGVGGGYSAITGDGNILNSMLTGAAIGGAGAYGIGSMGAGSAATQAAMAGPFFGGPATAPVAAGVGGGGGGAAGGAPALTASQTAALNSTNVAELNALSAKAGLEAGAGSGLMAAPNIITPQIMAASGAGSTAAGLSGMKMLGYGLAGTTALQLLGNQNRSSAGGGYKEDEYDRRLKGYKISPNYQPYQAPTPNPYYRPTYAAVGGIMNSNIPHSFDDETGSDDVGMAAGGFNMANGGMTSLGGYSDGGRMLKGPGDGMSDSIPGVIGGKQPARLADGEFVVPADVVSHLGNGSTDAGAKRLYSMMDNIRQARTGKKKQAPEINVDKYLPVKKASGGIAGYSGGGDATSDDEEKMRKNIMKNLKHSSTEDLRMAMDSMDDQKFLMKNMPNYAASMSPPLQGMIEGNQYGDRMGRSYMESAKNNALKNGKNFEEQSSDYAKIIPKINDLQNYGGIASIGKQLDPETRLNLMADIQRSPYDRNTLEAIRRIGGGVSRKLDKDSNLSAYYEQDPMGRSKSGGVRYTQNFAMGGGVNGGTVGYADGGDIAGLYQSVLGRAPDAAGLAAWQKALDTGTPLADIKTAFQNSQEARTNTINQIYNEQLGRAPEAEGLTNWMKVYNSGQTADQISKAIATAKEGQDLDKQSITSAYRQVLGRNPEPEGQQFWLSVAQNEGLTTNQLKDRIAAAAVVEQKARNLEPGKKFTQMELDALGSDPYGGYYSEKSIYDVAPDAQNVSKIGDRNVQFTTPVTQQAVVSQFINGIYTAKQGLDVLNTPHAMAGLNVALANGSLSTKDYDNLVKDLNSSKTPAEVRAALSKPKAQVIIDAAYGQQIGEAATLAEAQREAAQRQAVLTGKDPGYYLSNQVLTDAYQKAGVSIPFQYDFYKGVDTRDTTSNLLTKDNFSAKKDELVNAARTNPYRVQYDPLNQPRTPVSASIRDPYSDEGLKILYGQMMDQYGTQPTVRTNPATVALDPYTYKPPVPQRLLDEQNAKAAYDAKVAADRLAYENAPLSAQNFNEKDYITRYPDAFQDAPGRPYQHYLEANANGDVRTANKLPFTPTPFTSTPLFGPGSGGTAVPVAPAAPAAPAAPVGERAGGLMAINRKKHKRGK